MKEIAPSTPILAIVIGVSSYSQKDIVPLPAAQVDAVNFARALHHWGIPENNIYLLLNEEAEKNVIDDIFSALADRTEDYKLIFYFCGHGFRDSAPIPKSYLFFFDSLVNNNKITNSISLDLIIKKISKLNAKESYVIIDACYLRINTLRNPKLEEEIKGQKISHKSLFCLLSSGIEESFESEKGHYGYFTDALLKSLCKIRHSDCSPSELLNLISKELENDGLPLPEVYNIGNQKISFVSNRRMPDQQKGFIYRHEVMAKIQDELIQNRQSIVCLRGDVGVGKSVICRYLASENLKAFYFCIPFNVDDSFDPIDYFAKMLQKKFGSPFESLSSKQLILDFDSKFPYYLIIIDQIERLNQTTFDAFFEILTKMKSRIVLTSRQSLQNLIPEQIHSRLLYLEIPTLSFDEGQKLIQTIHPESSELECKMIYLVSQGNPLKIRKISLFPFEQSSSKEHEQDFKKALSAVYSAGAYINEHLFAKTFNLQEKTLRFLEEIGLIFRSEDGWIPHEFVSEIAESEKLALQHQATLNYWYQQIDDLPDHTLAAKHLILAVKCFGYEEEAQKYLKIAFQTLFLNGQDNLGYLIEAAEIFLTQPYLTETSLSLAEFLLEWSQFEWVEKLLRVPTKSSLLQRSQLCKAHLYWRTGRLTDSIVLCTQLLKEIKQPLELIKCYFYRAIAYFLKGRWTEAFSDFTYIHQNSPSQYYEGRAQCMLGTILGQRGTDFQRGKEYLETGTRLLIKLKDFSGAWMGWNNLGEMFWKSGEFRSSAFYLEKALETAQQIGNKSAILESLRNLLQLHLRMSGPFSKQASEMIQAIESMNPLNVEFFECIQILNTLTTAYLFRGDIQKAIPLLKKALSLKTPTDESRIYTASNLALLFKLLGRDKKATELFNKALMMAQKDDNQMAVLQLKNDYKMCCKEGTLNEQVG